MTSPRLSLADYRKIEQHVVNAKPKKPSKYKNVAVRVGGVRFASKAEARRDAELHLLQKAGKLRDLSRQPRFDLTVNGKHVCTYVGDWQYTELMPCSTPEARDIWVPQVIVEDRKGALTKEFRIKWALAKALFPEICWRLS